MPDVLSTLAGKQPQPGAADKQPTELQQKARELLPEQRKELGGLPDGNPGLGAVPAPAAQPPP